MPLGSAAVQRRDVPSSLFQSTFRRKEQNTFIIYAGFRSTAFTEIPSATIRESTAAVKCGEDESNSCYINTTLTGSFHIL